MPFRDYTDGELRYRMLSRTNPKEADELMARAEAAIRQKWELYEVMATTGEHPAPLAEVRRMTDLATTYLGLRLKHPVVASAGPLSRTLDGIRQLEDAGAAAIVLFSLFEEQIRLENAATEHLIGVGTESFPEALDYFPAVEDYEVGPEPYLELIRRAREAADGPDHRQPQRHDARGLGRLRPARSSRPAPRRSSSTSTTSRPTSRCTGREVEELYLDVLRAVKAAVRIPVAMKLNPFFSALGEMARQLVSSGADGLVLFNRFYQPDFDLETLEVAPTLELSRPERDPPAAALDRHPARAARGLARRHHRRALGATRWSSTCSPAPTR